jgi:uncharacterized phage protein (TIGR01671 family)
MREILFRAKRSDASWQWVYGFICRDKNFMMISHDPRRNYHVKIETLGQYTGLKDRNGVKIFEGDVIESVAVPSPARFEVIFNLQDDGREISDGTQSAEFCLKDGEGEYMCFFRSKKMRIIGNIHDAPELLKGGEA